MRAELPYVRFESDAVKRFTGDYIDHYARRQGLSEQAVQILVSFEDWLRLVPAFRAPLRQLEQQLARDFLLSTDFFQRQQEQLPVPVRYQGLASPYLRPCRHPFRQPVGTG
ncbi:MAG: hypothetical protein SV765_14210 [Pseudomonadota bacterium]|nr:hypothetical protein [Pseudomonadota bacterium]